MGTATGFNGGAYDPDVLISDMKMNKYDAVIVIGGYDIMKEYENQDLRNLVIEATRKIRLRLPYVLLLRYLQGQEFWRGRRLPVSHGQGFMIN